jgi:hypothetical protein
MQDSISYVPKYAYCQTRNFVRPCPFFSKISIHPSPESKAVTILRKKFEIFPTHYRLKEQYEVKKLMILRVHGDSLFMLTLLGDIVTMWNAETASVV